jgi:hypothetical protein
MIQQPHISIPAMINRLSRLSLPVPFLLALACIPSVHAQANNIFIQQANLQGLLDNAITATRNNDKATACQLRGQALGILSNNFDAFAAAFPTNNWNDLQASLQDSVTGCQAKGF